MLTNTEVAYGRYGGSQPMDTALHEAFLWELVISIVCKGLDSVNQPDHEQGFVC